MCWVSPFYRTDVNRFAHINIVVCPLLQWHWIHSLLAQQQIFSHTQRAADWLSNNSHSHNVLPIFSPLTEVISMQRGVDAPTPRTRLHYTLTPAHDWSQSGLMDSSVRRVRCEVVMVSWSKKSSRTLFRSKPSSCMNVIHTLAWLDVCGEDLHVIL